jgi:uncharacterized membrane protein YhaH (DUF805 family)
MRSEYWWFQLAILLAALAVVFVSGLLAVVTSAFSSDAARILGMLFVVAAYGVLIAAVIPSITVTVRRLHDTGKSAHYLWFGLIPFVGGIVLFVFMLLESDRGDNAYGPQPGSVATTDAQSAVSAG